MPVLSFLLKKKVPKKSALYGGFRPLRQAAKGLRPLDTRPPFKKGGTQNSFFDSLRAAGFSLNPAALYFISVSQLVAMVTDQLEVESIQLSYLQSHKEQPHCDMYYMICYCTIHQLKVPQML